MKIDFDKLRRLETVVRYAHLVVMDVADRRRDARLALSRLETSFEINLRSYTQRVRDEIDARWLNANPEFVDRSWFPMMRRLDEQRAEVKTLDQEYEEASARHGALLAPMAALRRFASQHGHRKRKNSVAVSNSDNPLRGALTGGTGTANAAGGANLGPIV